MNLFDSAICDRCKHPMKPYDKVKRIVRKPNGEKDYIYVVRQRCPFCGHIRRVLPLYLLPYRHYAIYVIQEVLNETADIYDYPCDETIKRWKREINTSFMNNNK